MTAITTPPAPLGKITDDDLLARVTPDPIRPGPDRWRVVAGNLPAWALIQYLNR